MWSYTISKKRKVALDFLLLFLNYLDRKLYIQLSIDLARLHHDGLELEFQSRTSSAWATAAASC